MITEIYTESWNHGQGFDFEVRVRVDTEAVTVIDEHTIQEYLEAGFAEYADEATVEEIVPCGEMPL